MNVPRIERPATWCLLFLVVLATGCSLITAQAGDQPVSSPPRGVNSTDAVASFDVPTASSAASTIQTPTTTDAAVSSTSTTTSSSSTSTSTTLPATTTSTTTTIPVTTTTLQQGFIGAAAEPIEAVGTRDGEAMKTVQSRLLHLGFWNSGADGEYGLTTKQAVMAFQKYSGLEASGAVDETTAAALGATELRASGRADTGTLIEIDKQRQLLFVIVDGQTVWTFNTSTGNGEPYEEPDKNSPGEVIRDIALTPDGLWKVDRERPEGWWEGDLGEIYRPKYFKGGIAVHGSNNVPNYPASHGCVRVSVPAMDFIWAENLMPLGTTVWVHNG